MIGKGKPNSWRVCVKASFGRGAPVHLVRDHLSTSPCLENHQGTEGTED